MTLAKVTNLEEIVTALHSDDWGDSNATFNFAHKGNEVQVTWSMTNNVGTMPWNKYFSLPMKSMLKKQFDQGLTGIKFYSEKS